ncbi:glyceraldehyde-3-phosphate dehydrogenase 1 [Agyrium rufum]|nr:glyceraldehyde-3-phosphate dehydrogenase 1 [Agyrium rufum]
MKEKRNSSSFSSDWDSPDLSTAWGTRSVAWGETKQYKPGMWTQIWEGFKRDPNAQPTSNLAIKADGTFDAEAAAHATANTNLVRTLKGRHLQMIAIGGSIGTGLFVGSGKALHDGGPASLVICFTLIGFMLYSTVQALGEMAVAFPVAGSFAAYSTRFLDPAWGFAMGWNYAIQWLVVLPLEIVSASITVQFWGDTTSNAVWTSVFLILIVGINLFGVRGYAEAEFIFALIKITAIVGFILLGIILNIGGGPGGAYIGFSLWRNPGAFANGFKGLCSVFVTAAFAFGGTELVGLAAAETANPRRSLPTACKQVFWRICLFYLISLTLVGLLVPYTDKRLIGDNQADGHASPFVISITNAGIQGLDSVFNVVIMISVLSVGNSAIYASSRTLAALAEQGQAPRFFAYIDRRGRPLYAVLFASVFGLFSFISASSAQESAFDWLLAISGLSSIFTWASICLCHIRFRKAWYVQGHTLDELAFTSQAGIVGSWLGFILNVLILVAQFWVGFAPIGYASQSAAENVSNFFQVYLAAPIVLACYIPYKLYYRTPFMRSHQMDITTGMRDLNLRELIAEERAEQANWPKWKKFYKLFC